MIKKILLRIIPLLLFFGQAYSQNLEGVKIYINPGHGGFDSDDRNVPVSPFALGDTAGFWESKSNLVKGLHLRDLLENAGAEVIMSRTQNRTEDDRPLSAIAEEANANQMDFMLSIHSNAFNGVTNYVLQLFHGWDNNPILPGSLDLANLFGQNLISNQTSHWTYSSPIIRGDKSFAPENWNGYGVLRPLTVPGLISEGSFHDYTPETYRLLNREYKHMEAWHLYKAFLEYFDGGADPNGQIAGYVKDNFRKVTDYYTTANTKDQWLPVNGAKVTLQPGDLEYNVDSLNNGFFLFDNLEPGIYQLQIEADKYETQIVDSVEVQSNEITYHLCYLEQDRSDPMEVLDYAPKAEEDERVSAASEIEFHFNFEVARETFEEAFSIEPFVEGTFAFENQERTAKFIPVQPLEISTLYMVTLDKSVEHIGGLSMEEDLVFSFTTDLKNRLSIVNKYPKDGMEYVYPETEVRIHFDGRLNNDDLAGRIKVEDLNGNELNRSGVKLNEFAGNAGSYSFEPDGLEIGETYVLKLDSALEDEEGLRLLEDMEIYFTIAPVHQPEAAVVIDFEQSALSWDVDTAASQNINAGPGNRILRYSSAKLFDNYSYRLLYDFTDENAHVVARPPEPLFSVKNGQFAGIYIWGNLSNNKLIMLFEQNGSEYEAELTAIDFAGWQFRNCELDLPESEEDYNFTGFKLVSNGSAFSFSGVIFFDNLMVSDTFFTSAKIKNLPELKIYPNPAKDHVTIENPGLNKSIPYQITSLSGKTVQQGTAHFSSGKTTIELKNRQKGIFIISLKTKEKAVNTKIIVK
ncbi:MAG: N-acetylmuramoyl-L-alanine amidase [Bacteroidota bacterium]